MDDTKSIKKVTEKVNKATQPIDYEKRVGLVKAPKFSPAMLSVIKKTIAKDLNIDEFAVYIYRARAYFLDPLKGEISVQVRWKNDPEKRQMVVVVQRDGYLTIAHRSGMFGGMQSGVRKEQDPETKKWLTFGWARVWSKAHPDKPVEIEVDFNEYCPDDTSKSPLWKTKPKTMIQKVAESQALRRAFNISGVYETAELDTWDETKKVAAPASATDNEALTPALRKTVGDIAKSRKVKVDVETMTQGEARAFIAESVNAGGKNGNNNTTS
jgi:phage recombination protein Bet